jgi:hypothetical protein
MPKPDCLGMLFLHTDHHCVGGKGRPACPSAAECATLCEGGPRVESQIPTWAELNLACVDTHCPQPRYDLGLIDIVFPELATALKEANENTNN